MLCSSRFHNVMNKCAIWRQHTYKEHASILQTFPTRLLDCCLYMCCVIMITGNQQIGPRNLFPTHNISTTISNKTEIRRTEEIVEHSTTKTTETYTTLRRNTKNTSRKNCTTMTIYLRRYQLRKKWVSLFCVLCALNYCMQWIMIQYPSFKGTHNIDAQWIVAKIVHVRILSSCSREDLIGHTTERRLCANSDKRQRIRWSINIQ